MLALAALIAGSYCTLLPFVGFFIRLTKSVVLNDALTLFYAVVYWAPFSFVMNVYARLFLSHKVATFRNARPSFVKKNAYNYSSDTDIFYSKDYSDLDDSLEEWGTVEYLPFVYNAVLNKYNTRLNFKQDLHGPLLDLVTHSTDDEFRVLDIGPGTGNSTMDISSALRNACVPLLETHRLPTMHSPATHRRASALRNPAYSGLPGCRRCVTPCAQVRLLPRHLGAAAQDVQGAQSARVLLQGLDGGHSL